MARVDEWLGLVRNQGRERAEGQLERLMGDLGGGERREERPVDPGELALWVGALINPLPALGVAMEVRGHLLEEVNLRLTHRALERALWGLTSSIQHMTGQPIDEFDEPEWS